MREIERDIKRRLRDVNRQLRREWWERNSTAATAVGLVAVIGLFGWHNWWQVSGRLEVACMELAVIYDEYHQQLGFMPRAAERACQCTGGGCQEESY